jgi:NADPH:quinone reductase-like Zn-dependent oxidoreductase
VKAALYERHGAAAEVLRGTDIERPDPGPGEVRVRVEVSGVNPTDWKLRSGATPQAIDRFQIPHHDAAGVIDAVRACMTANVTMKFVLIYAVPMSELERAANGITQALRDGALSELPVRRFALSDIAAAHDAVEAGEVGKVVVIPA